MGMILQVSQVELNHNSFFISLDLCSSLLQVPGGGLVALLWMFFFFPPKKIFCRKSPSLELVHGVKVKKFSCASIRSDSDPPNQSSTRSRHGGGSTVNPGAIWLFPKIGVPQNGCFIMEIPIKNGGFGCTTIFGNIHICTPQPPTPRGNESREPDDPGLTLFLPWNLT